jgi:hypothetical protein
MAVSDQLGAVSMNTGSRPPWSPVARWGLIGSVGVLVLVTAAIVTWIMFPSPVNHWLAVHTGTVNESGPYYGFWSGFGSDIAELSILGAIGTAAYQLVKKYNCHEPGCWRVGTHPAAGGQFLLCYHHHPDYQGSKPTHDLIVRLHREHAERQSAMRDKLHDVHQRIAAPAMGNENAVNGGTSEHLV